MPYLPNINSYLQQSSLLLQAYPITTRITTKYSLPPKEKTKISGRGSTVQLDPSLPPTKSPAATLTFKTFETTAGICLKYRTNKSAEVGRLMTGLGRLAKGETVEESSATFAGAEAKEAKAEAMEIDAPTPKTEKLPESAGVAGKARKKRGKK
jgi:Signal recognition particle 9 kDa protein (SRP9)